MLALALTAALVSQAPSPQAMDIEQAMRGVVLLVTTLGDGMAGYGSGVVVDDTGNIVTNLHVLEGAKQIHALTYDPARPSYAAIDGGLPRLVFEREKELVPVRMVRGDPLLDLAIVRLEKPAKMSWLPLAKSEPKVGDAVTALGHPQQNFWTVTRGLVSGKHQGLLQHDAAVNKGNSGGPLLNSAGEVVGINTLFLKDSQGISYARPIALLSKLLEGVQAPVAMDRSTPRKAIESCMHARELGHPSYAQCVNWGSHYALFRERVQGVLKGDPVSVDREIAKQAALGARDRVDGGPKKRAREIVRRWLEEGDGRADVWVQRYGPFALAFTLSDDAVAQGKAADAFFAYVHDATRGGKPPKAPARHAETRTMAKEKLRVQMDDEVGGWTAADQEAFLKGPLARSGLKVSTNDVAALRKTMKMGLRVDEVVLSGAGHAWVALSGKNLDGSGYRYAVLMVKAPDGWREQSFVTAVEQKAHPRPKSFPPALPFSTLAAILAADQSATQLAYFIYADLPDGIAWDWDYEHTWPAFLDALRRGAGPFASTARTLEAAIAP